MKKYFIAAAIFCCSSISFAQQGFVATGGDAVSGTGSVSYTVGQIDYNVYSNTSHLIIEGLQQPYSLSVVSISLLYFTATPGANNSVMLNWSTVSEFNNDFFTIERSKDGIHFEFLQNIPSKGNSNSKTNYAAIDRNPFNGYTFYRLKQTHKDGGTSLSQIEKLYVGEKIFSATVSPNPTRDLVQLKINGLTNKKYSYFITNLAGKKMLQGIVNSNTTLVNFARLPQATYVLQVLEDGKLIQIFRIIKSSR